jgi:hypothetical protein
MACSRLLATLAAFVLCAVAAAHPGGLDSSGGHYNRKTGGYHSHRSSYTPPINTSGGSSPSSLAPSAPAKPKAEPAAPKRWRPEPVSEDDELGVSQMSEPVRSKTPAPKPSWADLDPVAEPAKRQAVGAASYAEAHSLQLRAFHDSKGVLVCIGEVSATHRETATVVTATGEERSLRLSQLSLADRAFVAAEHSRESSDFVEELSRQHGYRVWRTVLTGSTLKAKAIAYDGKNVTLKGKTPKVTVVPTLKLSVEDGAYLERLATLSTAAHPSVAAADR